MHPSQINKQQPADTLADTAMKHYHRLLRDYVTYDQPVSPYLMSPAHARERHLGVLQGLLAAAAGKDPGDRLIHLMIEEQATAARKEQPR